MDLTQLSKEDKIKELIKSVKSKNSMRTKFFKDTHSFSDKELKSFFNQVCDRIDHITDSPTFNLEEANSNLSQKSVQTLKFLDLETCIGYILRSESIESSITYFYDILKANDGSISFRYANVFDEQRRIREERNKKIDEVLEIINKPR
jgi:hypothetical protein